jgi:hypothetical protein
MNGDLVSESCRTMTTFDTVSTTFDTSRIQKPDPSGTLTGDDSQGSGDGAAASPTVAARDEGEGMVREVVRRGMRLVGGNGEAGYGVAGREGVIGGVYARGRAR